MTVFHLSLSGKLQMNSYSRWPILLIFLTAGLILTPPAAAQNSTVESDNNLLPTPATKKDLYPANADAVKDLNAALKRAAAGQRYVLLVFGGNWCYDCHVLDQGLHEGEAGQLIKDRFELVHVDIGEADKNIDLAEKYRIPLEKGVPAVAVLSSNGTLVYSSGSGEFEAARMMTRKELVSFLKRWLKDK